MIYLTKEELISINHNQVLTYGGKLSPHNNNIENQNAFDYLLGAVEAKLGGQKLFPTVYDKAMAYIFHVIKDHIFYDGCKRTGLRSALTFLAKNKYFLKTSVTEKMLIKFPLDVENNTLNKDQISKWFKQNTEIRR